MLKLIVNSQITKMKKIGFITCFTLWMFEQDEEVMCVGIKIQDWEEIWNKDNTLLTNLSIKDKLPAITVFLANTTLHNPCSKKTPNKVNGN